MTTREPARGERAVACRDCGQIVGGPLARAFWLGLESVLCHDCALARGGSYDSRRGWIAAPRIEDLVPGSRT